MDNAIEILGMLFLAGGDQRLVAYHPSYSIPLVVLSYLFACVGSYAGLLTAERIDISRERWERSLWLGAGAMAMGCGVWSMHFIGMHAYSLPIGISYDIGLTVFSVVPAIAASFIALLILRPQKGRFTDLLFGAILIGAGIGSMHFIGMAAVRGNMSMAHDPTQFALAVVLAMLLAYPALAVKFSVRRMKSTVLRRWANIVSAPIMGLAIAGMHYAAMSAAVFFEGDYCLVNGPTIGNDLIVIVVNGLMFGFIVLVVIAVIARRIYAKSALLSAIIDNSADGLIVSDQSGTIRKFSPGAARIFGYSPEEITGQNLAVLVPPRDRRRHASLVSGWNGATHPAIMGRNREIEAMRRDGTRVPVEITVSDICTGQDALYVATIRDITQHKEMERVTQAAHESLKHALAEQLEANQIQRDFVTMASHEFRTPLAIIDGGAQRILRRVGTMSGAELTERVHKVRGAVARMQRLMEGFLASARTEFGTIDIARETCDPRAIVARICEESRLLSPTHTIDVDVSDLPPLANIDPHLIGQVISNVLSNAIKYSPDADRIEVHGGYGDGWITLTVRDFGIGIPPDETDKVFARFFRASTSTGIPGTGIGLNLSKHIVEQHGGSIEVKSVVGVGSMFTINLPTWIAEDQMPNATNGAWRSDPVVTA